MLREALDQIQARLPANKNVFLGLSGFSRDKVLSHVSRFPFAKLPLHTCLVIMQKWWKISITTLYFTLGRRRKKLFQGDILKDTVEFWLCIRKHKNTTGSQPYKELPLYALTCLSTPISNAVCEQIFSLVNSVKTELRNRLNIKILDSILRIKLISFFWKNAVQSFLLL